MNGLVRTTITLPGDLYESLRLQAFQQSTSFSGIVKKKLSSVGDNVQTGGFMKFAGKYHLGTKKYTREEIYDELIRKDMARGFHDSSSVCE